MAATSQWLFLEGVMRGAGADPRRVSFLRDLDAITTMHLWRAGVGDYFLAGALAAQELKTDGYFVASTMAALYGPVPWTVYYTSRSVLGRRDGMLEAFTSALQQALDWLHAHGDEDVADGIKACFPSVPEAALTASIRQLRADGMWRHDTLITRQPFDAYQKMIAEFGLIDEPFPFADVVAHGAAG
jgi:NitT/TauT family transport system substrate-binding protein